MDSMFQIQKSSKPTYGQLALLLDDEIKDNMNSFIDFLEQLKLKPHWYATNSFHFKYKGRIIFRFHIGKNGVDIFFTVAEKSDLDSILTSLPQDVKSFYLDHLRLCSGCNPKHGSGKKYSILNKDYWICAEPEMRILNPTHEQFEYLKKFITIRRENILDHIH